MPEMLQTIVLERDAEIDRHLASSWKEDSSNLSLPHGGPYCIAKRNSNKVDIDSHQLDTLLGCMRLDEYLRRC